jgi:hypothetical protein
VILGWWADEEAAWRLVHRVAADGRHWPARLALIDRMAQWSERYGFAGLDGAVPTFGRECFGLDANAMDREIEAAVDDDIESRNHRLERLDRILVGCAWRTLAAHSLLDEIHWMQNELRTCDSGGPALGRQAMARMCDAHAGVWQRLREWLDEPRLAANPPDPAEKRFRRAIARVDGRWRSAWFQWHVARAQSRRPQVAAHVSHLGKAAARLARSNGA